MTDAGDDDGFLSRWSRRKAQARRVAVPGPEVPKPTPEVEPSTGPSPLPPRRGEQPDATPVEAPPTLSDVAQLTRDSDFARFVGSSVEPDVRNAALKKLFSDPHFNLMDGLDVYIDDYNRPDPLPPAMLLKLAHAKYLGLLTQPDEPETANRPDPGNRGTIRVEPPKGGADAPPLDKIASNEDADLQLQSDDAAGRSGAQSSPGQDSGRKR